MFRLITDGGWAVFLYTGLYSFVIGKSRNHIELAGESRLHIHPSTNLNIRKSKILVENGTIRVGIAPFYGSECGAALSGSVTNSCARLFAENYTCTELPICLGTGGMMPQALRSL